jgi:hypothetical protein
MTNRHSLAALAAAAMLCCWGCFAGRPEITLTREPSIERAMDLLRTVPAAEPLVRFLHKNPVRIEYYEDLETCIKFSPKTGVISLPRGLKDFDAAVAIALARAAYIHRLYVASGLDEVILEEEEISALFQARIGLAIGIKSKDFPRNKAAKALKSDFCTYIMEGSGAAVIAARTAALSVQPACQRPLDTLRSRRIWLDEVRNSMDDIDSFFQLQKSHDLAKVRKGTLKMSDAIKNDAALRTMPAYELYRYQRALYDSQADIFTRMDKLYRSAIKDDEAWRQSGQALIDGARKEFSDCNLPE